MFHNLKKLTAQAVVCLGFGLIAIPAQSASRADIQEFLEVTGFDVALESIAVGAEDAPIILGLENDAFGITWSNLVREVFVVDDMKEQALEILEATLDQKLLDHAVEFYGSDLGQRLVAAENLSHMDDDELKQIAGAQLIEFYATQEDPRPAYYARMNTAIDPENLGLRAIQTIQVRFIVAASRAGVIRQDIDEGALWAQIESNQDEVIAAMDASGIAGAAYTYQDFSPEDVLIYTEALEHPDMQLVYQLMNAVHYQVMGDRFEVLATRLGGLQPSEDL